MPTCCGFDSAHVSGGGRQCGRKHLAAAVALALRDEGKIKLRAQILVYPLAVDLTMSGPQLWQRFTKDVLFDHDDAVRAFVRFYVPNVEQRKDWRASPLLAASSLKGLPPSLALHAGFDPLDAEGEVYAARLEKE